MFKKTTFLSLALLAANHLSADIHNDYIFAKFGNKPIEEKKVENPLDQKFTFFKPEFFDAQTLNLSDRDAYENIFNTSSSTHNAPFALSLIGEDTFKKLEIVIGDENKQASLVLKKFDKHLSTASGAKKLITTLSNPTDNIQEILHRQAIIGELIENEALFNELDALVTQQTHAEKQLAILSASTPIVNQNVLKMLYPNIPGMSWVQKNSIILELQRDQELILPTIICSLPITLPALIIKSIMKSEHVGITQATKIFGKDTIEIAKNLPGIIAENITLTNTLWAAYCTFALSLGGSAIVKMLQTKNTATKHIQQLLIDISTYTRTSKEIRHLISNNAVLSNSSEFTNILHLGNAGSTSDKLNNVIANLNTNTFKGKPSFFSYSGRTLATYRKIQEVKNEFIPLMEAIGTLDMYLAVTKLYKEHQNKKNSFCFTEFVENNTPMLQAEGFWNPFIDADVVVPNDAYLGNDVPNIILTGPNECGKSTILKGLTFNVLLAQTFGIAPAKSLRLTPFSKINCYLNITDDTSAGKSLFRAQVEMSKKLIEELRNMPSDKFVFTIMDELFTGTSAHEGEQAAYIYAEKLMEFENSITVLATHFDKLKDLETASNGKYINFQVEAIRAEDNTITRTFKMKPGFSTMNIAFDILAEAGVI